jgi:DNA-directed RNA polymerase subunit K/omega
MPPKGTKSSSDIKKTSNKQESIKKTSKTKSKQISNKNEPQKSPKKSAQIKESLPDEDDIADTINDVDDNVEEEMFFNEDSYKAFIKKNGIIALDKDLYINNNLHHIIIKTPKKYRRTSEIMTQAEYTRVLAERAKQIENGSPITVDIKDETDLRKIAITEILQKQCPLQIQRMVTKNIMEIWSVNEMIIPFHSRS